MTSHDLIEMFTYHSPFGDQAERYQILREKAKTLALTIYGLCPESREKSLAITYLQTAVMMANASIAIHEVKPPAPEVTP